MNKMLLLVGAFIVSPLLMWGQDKAVFSVRLSSDSILLGNYFEVRFTLENAQGDQFEAPDFEEFYVVTGPNVSSNFSMINGTVSQQVTYSYYLEPKETGNYYIQPASIIIDGSVVETEPVEVLVVPNPDGVKQNPNSLNNQQDLFFDFRDRMRQTQPVEPKGKKEPAKKKKKRKTYKI